MPDILVVVPKLWKPNQGTSVVHHVLIQTSGVKEPRVNYPYQPVQCQKNQGKGERKGKSKNLIYGNCWLPREILKEKKEVQLNREITDNTVLFCSFHKSHSFLPVSPGPTSIGIAGDKPRFEPVPSEPGPTEHFSVNFCDFLILFLSLLQNHATCHKKLTVLRLLFLDMIQNQHPGSKLAVCISALQLGSLTPHSTPGQKIQVKFQRKNRSLAALLQLFCCWL